MRDEADILKWFFVIGVVAMTFKALAKVAAAKLNAPKPLQDFINA